MPVLFKPFLSMSMNSTVIIGVFPHKFLPSSNQFNGYFILFTRAPPNN